MGYTDGHARSPQTNGGTLAEDASMANGDEDEAGDGAEDAKESQFQAGPSASATSNGTPVEDGSNSDTDDRGVPSPQRVAVPDDHTQAGVTSRSWPALP